jgi:hypothetical protein
MLLKFLNKLIAPPGDDIRQSRTRLRVRQVQMQTVSPSQSRADQYFHLAVEDANVAGDIGAAVDVDP